MPTARAATGPPRAHQPDALGPRVYRRGRWYWIDLRPWGLERTVLRNPAAPGWPARGERTAAADVAARWKWRYLDDVHAVARRRQLGLPRAVGPLARAVDDFLAHRAGAGAVARNTRLSDATFLRTHLLEHFGPALGADAVDGPALQALFAKLVRAGYAPATVLRYRHSAGAFCRWLLGARVPNPAHEVDVPPRAWEEARAFTDEELAGLRAAADHFDGARARGVVYVGPGRAVGPADADAPARPRLGGLVRPPFALRLALELGVGTGGREAELAALSWPAFREADRVVRFTHQVARGRGGAGGGRLVGLKGKEGRTALVLPGWWATHARHAPIPARGRVLASPEGAAPTLLGMERWLQRLYTAAGVNAPGTGWHVLRHTYARLFVEAGGTLDQLQQSLGHQSIVTTQRSYGHLSEDKAAQLARALIYGERAAAASGGW